jgi:hypothetical protein
MNPDFPPLSISPPQVSARRREKQAFVRLPPVAVAERTEKIRVLRREVAEITNATRQLSPDQKRAIFLKLTHDRPLGRQDLRGTGLIPMGPSAAKETLVVPRKKDLQKLDERLGRIADDKETARPTGIEFVTSITSISIADPKARLSPEFAFEYDRLVEEEFIVYEVEVASFAVRSEKRAQEVEETLNELREFFGGTEGRVYETDFAGSGARVVLSSTGAKLQALVEDPRWWRRIVLFEKRPHFQTFQSVYQSFAITNSRINPPPPDAETICVIDTGIAAANPLLAPVLRTGTSRSFVDGFDANADPAGHGSGVASLAAYYQIDITEGGTNTATAFVASARITNDAGQLDTPYTDDDGVQRIREARLLSNVLKDVVRHFRPRGVRIFVLSFNIVGHIWSRAAQRLVPRNSWVARTIDQLSREHDVVFVAITGNILAADVQELSSVSAYPEYLRSPLAKLLDPGPATLAVTVGSIAQSERVVVAPGTPIARENQPSPFTRTGPGFANSIKPDFVERGGNLVRDPLLGVCHNSGTNIIMASGQLTPPLQHANGTSYAAPRVGNQLAAIIRDLRSIVAQPTASLLRAFLAISAKIPPDVEFLSVDETLYAMGYGLPDATRATECAGNSVVLFYQGELSVDQVALFRLPVPVEIRESGRELKRITLAVAAAPPVQAWGVAEYLGAQLKFRLFRGDKNVDEIVTMMQRDEEEENVVSSTQVKALPGVLGVRRRSVGTLQRDVFEWRDHEPGFSTDDYVLALSLSAASWCKAEPTNVPIGIAVRIEDTSGSCQQLYARVRARVLARVRAQA